MPQHSHCISMLPLCSSKISSISASGISNNAAPERSGEQPQKKETACGSKTSTTSSWYKRYSNSSAGHPNNSSSFTVAANVVKCSKSSGVPWPSGMICNNIPAETGLPSYSPVRIISCVCNCSERTK